MRSCSHTNIDSVFFMEFRHTLIVPAPMGTRILDDSNLPVARCLWWHCRCSFAPDKSSQFVTSQGICSPNLSDTLLILPLLLCSLLPGFQTSQNIWPRGCWIGWECVIYHCVPTPWGSLQCSRTSGLTLTSQRLHLLTCANLWNE